MDNIKKLLEIMAALRDEATGCPWDRAQDFASVAPYTIEEAYEVADAIERSDLPALRDELGDLLFQVVFHARMAEERGAFAFADVVEAITDKLLRRHPHVFGSREERDRGAEPGSWERLKADERRQQGTASVLDDVPLALPALKRADKLGRRAASVGFDWPDVRGVRAKIDEELAELDDCLADADRERMADELGDLLFTIANLGRHLDIDAESALAGANRKFERRFRGVEAAAAADGVALNDLGLDDLEHRWRAQKSV
ncbi:MAG: nucleoside triphosphate pyrophosphohydrolase [Woeseiaceae bacterium]|nr:nucleoside triphosphate pyrophosphohydrolase [Woeseiaceae bacterium]